MTDYMREQSVEEVVFHSVDYLSDPSEEEEEVYHFVSDLTHSALRLPSITKTVPIFSGLMSTVHVQREPEDYCYPALTPCTVTDRVRARLPPYTIDRSLLPPGSPGLPGSPTGQLQTRAAPQPGPRDQLEQFWRLRRQLLQSSELGLSARPRQGSVRHAPAGLSGEQGAPRCRLSPSLR
jgi:hypothetical protein